MLGGNHGRGRREAAKADNGRGLQAPQMPTCLSIPIEQAQDACQAPERRARDQPACGNHVNGVGVEVARVLQPARIGQQPDLMPACDQGTGQGHGGENVPAGAACREDDEAHRKLSCRGRRRVTARKMPIETASESSEEPP